MKKKSIPTEKDKKNSFVPSKKDRCKNCGYGKRWHARKSCPCKKFEPS